MGLRCQESEEKDVETEMLIDKLNQALAKTDAANKKVELLKASQDQDLQDQDLQAQDGFLPC